MMLASPALPPHSSFIGVPAGEIAAFASLIGVSNAGGRAGAEAEAKLRAIGAKASAWLEEMGPLTADEHARMEVEKGRFESGTATVPVSEFIGQVARIAYFDPADGTPAGVDRAVTILGLSLLLLEHVMGRFALSAPDAGPGDVEVDMLLNGAEEEDEDPEP